MELIKEYTTPKASANSEKNTRRFNKLIATQKSWVQY